VSRQTIYSIEDGSYVPNTTVSLQLSRALEVGVEEIFFLLEEKQTETLRAELLSDIQTDESRFVRVCSVNGRSVAVPASFLPAYLPTADGIIESRRKRTVSVKTAAGFAENGKRLLLAGCDPALSFLTDALHSSGIEIISVPCSSRRALQWLRQGMVHAAGSHLLDRSTGVYNVPIVRRLLPKAAVQVVTFAIWEQGLVIRCGNPKSIRTLAELGSRGVTIINRERGSGSRDLLDTELRRLSIRPAQISGYNSIAEGHLAAAYAVAAGTADCCIAPRSAALCFGLDFIPVAVERFDLTFAESALELPAAKALLDLLNRSTLRKKLQCIAGYDTTHTGEILI
jgi:molybdate-binding protein